MNENVKKSLKIIKMIIIIGLGAMIVIDVILVFSDEGGFPTFSKVFKEHRTGLIWMNLFYGGIIAKIFFNRKVVEKHWELSGFFTFLVIVVMLAVLGQIMIIEVDTPYQLMILICGGILAYRVWPQYVTELEPD